ncbi:MAG: SRPBCC family protein [Prevotella sp.]|nr:SRPBCC family protein [Prevotella sp.]
MSKFESNVKQIPYPQETVYEKLSDLSNIEAVKDRIPEDKLQDLSFDSDHITVSVPPVGAITLRIIDRDAPKCIKFETEQSPIPFNLWIQLLPVTEETSKMKLTLEANINPVLKGMISGPLKEGLEKIADMLSMIPYDNVNVNGNGNGDENENENTI